MTTCLPGRTRAGVALGLGGAVLVLPSALARLRPDGPTMGEIVGVELAGSGQGIIDATDGSPTTLAAHRRLVAWDNLYVACYTTPLLLGVFLLPRRSRGLGLLLVAVTSAADLVENANLRLALGTLLDPSSEPSAADIPAARSRSAARIKFGALIPAVGMAVAGVCSRTPASSLGGGPRPRPTPARWTRLAQRPSRSSAGSHRRGCSTPR